MEQKNVNNHHFELNIAKEQEITQPKTLNKKISIRKGDNTIEDSLLNNQNPQIKNPKDTPKNKDSRTSSNNNNDLSSDDEEDNNIIINNSDSESDEKIRPFPENLVKYDTVNTSNPKEKVNPNMNSDIKAVKNDTQNILTISGSKQLSKIDKKENPKNIHKSPNINSRSIQIEKNNHISPIKSSNSNANNNSNCKSAKKVKPIKKDDSHNGHNIKKSSEINYSGNCNCNNNNNGNHIINLIEIKPDDDNLEDKNRNNANINNNNIESEGNTLNKIIINANYNNLPLNNLLNPTPAVKEDSLNFNNFINSDSVLENPTICAATKQNFEDKIGTFENYDLQKLSYNIIKDYSELHIDRNENFMERLKFDVFKRQCRDKRINQIIEENKVKLNENIRIKGFNHLIEDANRRIEAQENMKKMKKKLNNDAQNEPKKTYSNDKWEEIYQKRFGQFLIKKEQRIDELKQEKKNNDKKLELEEEKIMAKTKYKPQKKIEESAKRMYDEAKKREKKMDKKIKDINEQRKYYMNANRFKYKNNYNHNKSNSTVGNNMNSGNKVGKNKMKYSNKNDKFECGVNMNSNNENYDNVFNNKIRPFSSDANHKIKNYNSDIEDDNDNINNINNIDAKDKGYFSGNDADDIQAVPFNIINSKGDAKSNIYINKYKLEEICRNKAQNINEEDEEGNFSYNNINNNEFNDINNKLKSLNIEIKNNNNNFSSKINSKNNYVNSGFSKNNNTNKNNINTNEIYRNEINNIRKLSSKIINTINSYNNTDPNSNQKEKNKGHNNNINDSSNYDNELEDVIIKRFDFKIPEKEKKECIRSASISNDFHFIDNNDISNRRIRSTSRNMSNFHSKNQSTNRSKVQTPNRSMVKSNNNQSAKKINNKSQNISTSSPRNVTNSNVNQNINTNFTQKVYENSKQNLKNSQNFTPNQIYNQENNENFFSIPLDKENNNDNANSINEQLQDLLNDNPLKNSSNKKNSLSEIAFKDSNIFGNGQGENSFKFLEQNFKDYDEYQKEYLKYKNANKKVGYLLTGEKIDNQSIGKMSPKRNNNSTISGEKRYIMHKKSNSKFIPTSYTCDWVNNGSKINSKYSKSPNKCRTYLCTPFQTSHETSSKGVYKERYITARTEGNLNYDYQEDIQGENINSNVQLDIDELGSSIIEPKKETNNGEPGEMIDNFFKTFAKKEK